MTVTYKPYAVSLVGSVPTYVQQVYPSDFPLAIVNGTAIVKGTDKIEIPLTNITDFSDEPAHKGTFEYAGVFQNTPLFFMRPDKAATMSFKITCNAYSSLPLVLKYCNCWGKLVLVETEFLEQKTAGAAFTVIGTNGAGITHTYDVTMEPTIKEKPVVYGKTQFDIDLKFTRVQI